MAKKEHLSKANTQVVQDEADAEKRYTASLMQARDALIAMQEDQARDESERKAAAITADVLRRAEEARQAAREVPVPEVHKTFYQKFKEFFSGPDYDQN